MNSNIFIPRKIKVGFNNRKDTYTGKLAYVIYTMIDACSNIPHLTADKVIIDGYSIDEWYNDLVMKYLIMQYEPK